MEAEGLSRASIGDLLGNADPLARRILDEYTRYIDLTSMPFDDALRYYLTFFQLPGEAQVRKIRLLFIFSPPFLFVENLHLLIN
jgi:Sec7-like guanine-nucleotide exchange factor